SPQRFMRLSSKLSPGEKVMLAVNVIALFLGPRLGRFGAAAELSSVELEALSADIAAGEIRAVAAEEFATQGTAAAPAAAAARPYRIYSTRELLRRAEEPGPYHNFPESFNDEIFDRGTKQVTPGFFKNPKSWLSNDSIMYRLRGTVNGREGTF